MLPEPTTRYGHSTTLWVHAPGYAWDKITVPLTERLEREIFLERGGDLEVTVAGPELPEGTLLRAYALSGKPLRTGVPSTEFALPAGGPVRIEGLKPGDYRLRCDKGHWFQEPLVLGHTDAAVVAGESRAIVVTVTGDASAPPLVPVAGTVHLPASWELRALNLEFDPIGVTRSWVPDSKRLPVICIDIDSPWDAGKLHAGDYQVIVAPFGARSRLTVGPAGATDVRVVVPERAEARVRVLDQESGRTLTNGSLTWYGELPDGVSGWAPGSAKFDADTSTFGFRAPSGRVHLDYCPGDRKHRRLSRPFDLQPGANELALEVAHACGIDVVLTDRDVALPWEFDWQVELRCVDGEGEVASWSGPHVGVTVPGRYEVEFPTVQGYRPIPPRTVTIEPGQWVEIKVALERL